MASICLISVLHFTQGTKSPRLELLFGAGSQPYVKAAFSPFSLVCSLFAADEAKCIEVRAEQAVDVIFMCDSFGHSPLVFVKHNALRDEQVLRVK